MNKYAKKNKKRVISRNFKLNKLKKKKDWFYIEILSNHWPPLSLKTKWRVDSFWML